VAVVVLVGSVGGAYALGVVGTPTVESAENRFTAVSAQTTTVETTLAVNNPNPIGVRLGGLSINYTVYMNDVAIADGSKQGIELERGNATVNFTTRMRNDRIPPWWVSHIRNGEQYRLDLDEIDYETTIETDMFGNKAEYPTGAGGGTATSGTGVPAHRTPIRRPTTAVSSGCRY